MKPDLDSPQNIQQHVNNFYDKVLSDELLAHIFTDVAGIDIRVHIPLICSYWEKLLLGDKEYQRHTMNIHREVNQQFPFTAKEFDRWLSLFVSTANAHFAGPKTQQAITLATTIAHNMQQSLQK